MFDDFNIHYKEGLVHLNNIDEKGRYCQNFSTTYKESQIIEEPTHVPDATGYAAFLDLFFFFTSYLEKCSTQLLPSLGTSKHSLVRVKVDNKSKGMP